VNIDTVELSKVVSQALRHAPEAYGLTLDPEGWANVQDLISALSRTHPELGALAESHLSEMIARSRKQRHEIAGGRIRALYGHSTPERLAKQPRKPPELLYHGTDPKAADSILTEGLKSMGRQYAHLSADAQTAYEVGKRKAARPVVLIIRAADAFESGAAFYEGNDSVWLADYVPPAYISVVPV
jgi:putative RNA 2'-phosphotransferase